MLDLSSKQIEKLSSLFMDLAKGSFLAAIALPAITPADLTVFFKLVVSGIVCAYFSLRLLKAI